MNGVATFLYRLYRRMSSSLGLHVPANVLILLKNLDEWSFNVFSVNEATSDGHLLKYIAYEIIQKYNLINKFRVCQFCHYSVCSNYRVPLPQKE